MRGLRQSRAFAAAAVLCAALIGCGTSPALRHYTAKDAAPRATAPRVAIIPPAFTIQIDGVWEIAETERAELRQAVEQQAMSMVVEALRARGYEPTMADASRAQQAIASIAGGFVYHANAVASGGQEGGTFDPSLVSQVAGGADAVLYVNGSAVAVTGGKRAAQVTVVVLIATLIAAIVVLVVLALRDTRVSAPSGPTPSVPMPVVSAGEVARAVLLPPPAVFFPAVEFHAHLMPIYWAPRRRPVEGVPAESDRHDSPAPPPKQKERGFFAGAQMRFFATLVDAATGKIIWHADHVADSDVSSPSELRESIQRTFSTLPGRLGAAP